MPEVNIMIVEDEVILAKELKIKLEDMGYRVTSIVNSGERAIESSEQDRSDLILMDINLKGKMDGIEAAEIIHSHFDIPVIFLTAYADEEKLDRAKLTLPFGYILKPYLDRDLKITIEMALYIAQADIERKQAQMALQKAHDELEQRVDERTGELAKANEHLLREIEERKKTEEKKGELEIQLLQAQKMEAIGTLAGGIAHDFNNILSPIIVHTEMVMMDIQDHNPMHSHLEQVMKAAMRARDLATQILTFSRQGKQEPKAMKISLVAKEAIKLLTSALPSTIEINYKFEAKADTVLADPTQIHQILMNLCTNAAHAMREKGGVLEVNLTDADIGSEALDQHIELIPGRPYLKMTVKDTGHGMGPDVLGRIFEPYFTTKQIGEGTGMGLSVAHGIVKKHNGAISVTSQPGKGTIFHIFLPVIEGGVKKEVETSEDLPKGDERILYIDDEKPMVDAVEPMLERLGYEVTARTSSIEALEAFRNKPFGFDIVITDQTMPNMTGAQLARELMQIRPDIPIILCTGFSELINEERARKMGIRAFVMKPIVMSKIAKTIREVLDEGIEY